MSVSDSNIFQTWTAWGTVHFTVLWTLHLTSYSFAQYIATSLRGSLYRFWELCSCRAQISLVLCPLNYTTSLSLSSALSFFHSVRPSYWNFYFPPACGLAGTSRQKAGATLALSICVPYIRGHCPCCLLSHIWAQNCCLVMSGLYTSMGNWQVCSSCLISSRNRTLPGIFFKQFYFSTDSVNSVVRDIFCWYKCYKHSPCKQ